MFAGVKCIKGQPIEYVCITNNCKIPPFLCQNQCECRINHGLCNLKSIKDLDEDIKTILKFQFFIVYSLTFRGKSIHVAGRYATQTLPPPQNQTFCLTYDPIPRFANETVSFKISKLRGCIGLGVFIRQILQRNEYRYHPDTQFLNHGAYMVMTNNLLYSNSRQDQNGKSVKKFNIKQGDIIKVKYENQKVFFISNFFEEGLNIDLKAGDHLHFGVYLYDVEDEVEIVNTFVCNE